ncbi:uncharacterized protein LOC141695315 [Apium graveolens]|uniref:uncharacterized protein LOC141695315 n=1 Tax=Apium graveolens TaxID=4045 RepID=UPI003D7A6999
METRKTKESSFGLNFPMLTKVNYTAWALKIKVFMQAHGVWDAIEPKDPKATVEDKTDKRALAIIYQGLPEDMLSIADKTTSKGAWEAVKILSLGAEKVKTARAHTLKGEFEALSMKDTDQLDDFYMKLNGLVTNIRALGEKMEEAYIVKKLLRAVPSRFLQIASTIEQFGDLEGMSVEEVISSLKVLEERLSGRTEANQGQLLLTEEEWRRNESNEGQVLLTREEWLKRTNKEGTRGDGDNRWKNGNHGGQDRSKEERVNPKLKESPGDQKETQVKFGDGSTVCIKGKGVVSFRCKNGEEKLLRDVYYIPALCSNIISLGQLYEDGNKVLLDGDYLWVYDEQGRLSMKVKKSENRLYKISLEEMWPRCMIIKAEENTWLWQSRMGHVNFQALELMSKEGMAKGIPRLTHPSTRCEGCLMSK